MSTIERGQVTIPFHKPGLKERLFFFISGVIVSIPLAIFFESLAVFFPSSIPEPYLSLFLFAFLGPFVEEFAKAYPLFYRHGETKKSVMTLGFLVGLGFGITEFLEYVLIVGAPIVFRLPGIFFHAALTSMVAYGIANKKSTGFYLVAVALHSSYNAAALFDPFLFLVPVVFFLTLFLFWYLYQKTAETFIAY
jgi:RsiW-degrading membrane proteinase PrsW (M82 family)